MKRKITIEIVVQEFQERGYKLLTAEYINNTQKLQYICPKHEDKGVLETTFANFTTGRCCPYCANRIRKTQEEYIKELHEKNPNILVLEKYRGLKTKIKHQCLVCEYQWETVPTNLLHSGQGCPRCSKRHYNKTQDEFVTEVNEVNKSIKVIGTYIDATSKIEFECMDCGSNWLAKPNNILNNKGCPNCKISKGEKKIAECLSTLHIDYKREHCFDECRYINSLPFDFYIPSHNICIEYDGEHHFKPCTFGGVAKEQAEKAYELTKIRDEIKTQFCKSNNIMLVRIPYMEYKNIKNIISSFF